MNYWVGAGKVYAGSTSKIIGGGGGGGGGLAHLPPLFLRLCNNTLARECKVTDNVGVNNKFSY